MSKLFFSHTIPTHASTNPHYTLLYRPKLSTYFFVEKIVIKSRLLEFFKLYMFFPFSDMQGLKDKLSQVARSFGPPLSSGNSILLT